jgi:6-pyruvoyl-tetrahydropterin synthase
MEDEMFDAAHYLDQLDEPQELARDDIHGHFHRIRTDYGFRNEIRGQMLDALKSIFSSPDPTDG